jgi:hypothetical protein
MGIIMGLDVAFKSLGVAVVDVKSARTPDDRADDYAAVTCRDTAGNFREKLLSVQTLHPPTFTKKSHPDMYVASKDYLMARGLAFQLYRLVLTINPVVIALELPSGGAQGARANRCMGMASAIVATMEALLMDQIARGHADGLRPFLAFLPRTPEDVKLAAAGSRSAAKLDVESAVLACYTDQADLFAALTKGDREHACDAAAAIWAVRGSDPYRRAALEAS